MRYRLEPKSYFANERTFIQWISAALLLVTIAAIVAEHPETHSHAVPISLFLVSCAGFIVLYSIFVYNRRLHLLGTGEAYGYVDKVGPTLLAMAALIGVVVVIIHFVYDGYKSAEVATVLKEGSRCVRHSMNGVNAFFVQPSDILLDEKRIMLLVPTLETILGVPLDSPTSKVQTLLQVENADLEAITYAGDRIFAIAEKTTYSRLHELEWVEENRLKIRQTWYLKVTNAEGIAFLDNQLWITDNNFNSPSDQSLNSALYVFDIPDRANNSTSKENPLRKKRASNRRLLSQGMNGGNSKIGALLYFEEKLFILHDNVKLIRVWDIHRGKLLYDIPLPASTADSSKQWEGFTIERRSTPLTDSDNGKSGLRGNDPPTQEKAILHLALDTPAQIWSLELTEDSNSGRFSLPACAGSNPVTLQDLSIPIGNL